MKTRQVNGYVGPSLSRCMVRISYGLAITALACFPARADLVGHWTFDETGGTIAHDGAGGSNGALSPTGSSFVGGGVSGNAVSINQGGSGYVTMGNVLSFPGGNFSFSMWIKMNPGDTTANTVILGKQNGGYVNGYLMQVNRGGNGGQDNKALFYAGGLATDGALSTTSVNDGNWHHVVGVYRGGVNKIIYVDGVAEGTNEAPAITGNTAPFLVGGVNLGSPASRFTGLVDDVQAYDHALTPDDALFLYQNPGVPVPTPVAYAVPFAHWKFDESGGGLARDSVGTSHGALSAAGSSFVTNGIAGGAISISQAASGYVNMGDVLQFTNCDFTLSMWIKMNPGDTAENTIVLGKQNGGYVNGYLMHVNRGGNGGQDNKALFYAGGWASDGAISKTSVNDGNWHHLVGVYRAGGNKVIYVDGVAEGTNVVLVIPGNTAPFLVGGVNLGTPTSRFTGLVDDVQAYGSALSKSQVSFLFQNPGQNLMPTNQAPLITSQPASRTVSVHNDTTFQVGAVGKQPLFFQWLFKGNPIAEATNSTLQIPNVQATNAGVYAVIVSNSVDVALSSDATLTVTIPPAEVRVINAAADSGATVVVPVTLLANGDENALGFSLNFDPSRLAYAGVILGSGAVGGSYLENDGQAGSGKVGLVVGLPAGATFAPGSREFVQVLFNTAVVTKQTTTPISFGDTPILRQLSDAPGQPLPATYVGGSVVIAAALFESDLSPRPNGDQIMSVTDWVLAGRYAARLDYPTNATEFQRADCAPRSTLGDGAILITDWVQTGRYIAGLDSVTTAGGPTSEASGGGALPPVRQGEEPRRLRVADGLLPHRQSVTICANLEAQGDENAAGFSLAFDPAVLTYTGATLGSSVVGGTLHINASQAAAGRLGFAVALSAGARLPAGTRELVRVAFAAATTNSCTTAVAPCDQPVPRQVSDPGATALPSEYSAGSIVVNPVPALGVVQQDETLALAWPLWGGNFRLQEAAGVDADANWTDVEATATTNGANRIVTVPVGAGTRFYRLKLQ